VLSAATKYIIPLPISADGRHLSSLLVCPRATGGSFVAKLHLFGCDTDPSKSGNWFGPLDRKTASATVYGTSTKRVGASSYHCAEAAQFDCQDFDSVGVLYTVVGTRPGFMAGSGTILDIFVQDVTA